jgi:FAD binding domain-containing protein
LAWKLALVHHGVADHALLDSYEAERRPIAERVTQSGDATEQAHTMTDPAERKKRDQAIKAMLADPDARHHEVVAETELVAHYSQSPVVCGDAHPNFGAGRRLPDTIVVERANLPPQKLHALAHRAGHTLLLLAGPARHSPTLLDLHAALQKFATEAPLFETAIAVGTQHDLPGHIGQFDLAAAKMLGVEGITLLAMRPDGYIGLRADRDHLNATRRYHHLLRACRPA